MDKKRASFIKYGAFLMPGTCCMIDSFLLDPFLLFFIGLFIVWLNVRKLMKKGISYAPHLCVFTLLLFWSVSISLYFNLPWVDWIATLCGAENGRDWMINSGIFHLNFESPSELTHVISGFLFAMYPVWLWLGIQSGYILFGRKPHHKGLISLFSLRPPK